MTFYLLGMVCLLNSHTCSPLTVWGKEFPTEAACKEAKKSLDEFLEPIPKADGTFECVQAEETV